MRDVSRRGRVLLMAGILALSGLAGCAAAARAAFTQPDVAFRGISVRGLRLDGADLEVLLHVFNPNGFGLDASQLRYRLLVDSLEIGSGAMDSGFAVAKRDSATIRLPVKLGFRALQTVGPRLLRGGDIPYRLIGDVSIKSFVGTFNRSFNEAGNFDVSKALRQ
jgi:LEA14-like dessication related protein